VDSNGPSSQEGLLVVSGVGSGQEEVDQPKVAPF